MLRLQLRILHLRCASIGRENGRWAVCVFAYTAAGAELRCRAKESELRCRASRDCEQIAMVWWMAWRAHSYAGASCAPTVPPCILCLPLCSCASSVPPCIMAHNRHIYLAGFDSSNREILCIYRLEGIRPIVNLSQN